MARDWNGTTDSMNCGSGTSIDDIFLTTNGGSMFVWIFPDNGGESTAGMIFIKQNTNIGQLVGFDALNNQLALFSDRSTNGNWRQSAGDTNYDVWNSFSCKYDPTLTTNDPTFCTNGVIQTVGSGITETSTPSGAQGSDAAQSLFIGNNSAASRTFDGYISHIIFWKGEAIGNNQMQAMSRGVNPFAIGSSTKPVLFMPIWGNDSPEFDLSGNNNDGTLTGTTAVAANPPIEHMSNYISGYC